MFTSPDDIWMDAGPTTFYAPWVEYGTIKMDPRSFVVEPGLELAPAWTAFCLEVAQLADAYKPISTTPFSQDAPTRSLVTRLRSLLYTQAKALGDVAVFGGRGIIQPMRSRMYGLARGLGDLQSAMNATVQIGRAHV